MQLHQLQPKHRKKRKKIVGRGGKRGKTSGRGHKGQRARAGHRIRPEARDAIKKIPKQRGHGKNRARTVHSSRNIAVPINISALEKAYNVGETVSPQTLLSKKVIRARKGKKTIVKILGQGTLTKKLKISRCLVSKTALEQIQKAGGTVNTSY